MGPSSAAVSVRRSPASPWKSPWRIVLIAIAVLLFLEGAVRVRQLVRYGSAGNDLFQTTRDAATGLLMPTPNQATLHIRIDSRGFRSPELTVPKPPGVVRLAFLGESNTFSSEATSNETTWPDRMFQKVRQTWPDVKFDFLNAAFGGYRVADNRRVLALRVKPLQPDVIIINQGAMDLYTDSNALARQTGVIPDTPNSQPDWLEPYSLLWKLVKKNVLIAYRTERRRGPQRTLTFDPPSLSRGFHDRLAALVDDATRDAPVTVLVTFPYMGRRGQSREELVQNSAASLFNAPWMNVDGLLEGFEEYNRVIRQVAREKGVILIDVADAIPADSQHFHDSVHYKDAGAAVMAEAAAAALVRAPALVQLVESRRSAVKAH